MYRKVKDYLEKNKMLCAGDTVLAGVSGGGDSMAMLHFLHMLSRELDFELAAVHVHHGIRGEEADRDWELVQKVCEKWKIPGVVYYYSVPALAKEWKMGIEETGRIVRKEAFDKEQHKRNLPEHKVKVALAHNRNDLAETMLHNLVRGSGLRGLSGMQAVSGNIIRPLLCLERKEIDHYLLENAIPYVTDSTNLEDHYTRNRIRHHVLPILQDEINEQALAHMAAAAEHITEADRYLESVGKKLAECYRSGEKEYFLTDAFWDEQPILQSYAVMDMLEKLAGKRKNLTQIHVRQVLDGHYYQTGKYIRLPYQLLLRKEYGGVRLMSEGNRTLEEKQSEKVQAVGEKWDLSSKEDIVFSPQEGFKVKKFFWDNRAICEKKYTKWFDYDRIQGSLTVRNRQPGDYLVIDQSGKRKKLSRYMIDEKIPQEQRDSILLLADGPEIVWVIGFRINEQYKLTRESRRAVEVKYEGGYEDERKN